MEEFPKAPKSIPLTVGLLKLSTPRRAEGQMDKQRDIVVPKSSETQRFVEKSGPQGVE